MKYGSLFSGIGGLDLGLDRAGMDCAWQVEIDEFCQKVLQKHWPDIPKYKDIKDVGNNLESVDLIAGGFPCQPHSVAGKQKGAEDDRNLWPEFIRIVRILKPRYVLGENVLGIVSTYLDTVLSDLEGEGYTCATFNLPACAFNAPHRRERIFIVAYSESNIRGTSRNERYISFDRSNSFVAKSERTTGRRGTIIGESNRQGWQLPETERESLQSRYGQTHSSKSQSSSEIVADTKRIHAQGFNQGQGQREFGGSSWWTVEPNVGRVAHGIPSRVDRLRGLGNAVVPQVAEWIGRRIIEFDSQGDNNV